VSFARKASKKIPIVQAASSSHEETAESTEPPMQRKSRAKLVEDAETEEQQEATESDEWEPLAG